jgi:hypothetical protein
VRHLESETQEEHQHREDEDDAYQQDDGDNR